MKKLFSILALMTGFITYGTAQCAMCRATLENNISNGKAGIAAGINTGILYLFSAPYVAICVIAYLWYRTSKINEQKQLQKGTAIR